MKISQCCTIVGLDLEHFLFAFIRFVYTFSPILIYNSIMLSLNWSVV